MDALAAMVRRAAVPDAVARCYPRRFRIPVNDGLGRRRELQLEPVATLGDDLGFADEPSVHRKGRTMCPKEMVPLQIDLATGL
jgi:hypothetical protein